jgi:hypothetical protein
MDLGQVQQGGTVTGQSQWGADLERHACSGGCHFVSKNLGGQESVTFSVKNMPDYVKSVFQPYESHVPH